MAASRSGTSSPIITPDPSRVLQPDGPRRLRDQVNDLRVKVRQLGDDYEYRVAKNSLLKRAAEGEGVAVLADHFTGPTAVAFSYSEPEG